MAGMAWNKGRIFSQLFFFAGALAIVYVVILIVVEFFIGGHTPGPIKHKPEAWTDVFAVIPALCFGYQVISHCFQVCWMSHFQCHISAIPIYSCMRQRTTKQFTLASSSAITICAAVYTVAGTCGYLTFGSNVEDDILSNYSATKPTVMVALIAMAAKTFTSYPILLFCGRFESHLPEFAFGISSQGRTGLFAQGLGAERRKCWEVGKGKMSHDLLTPWWGLIDYIVYHILSITLGSYCLSYLSGEKRWACDNLVLADSDSRNPDPQHQHGDNNYKHVKDTSRRTTSLFRWSTCSAV